MKFAEFKKAGHWPTLLARSSARGSASIRHNVSAMSFEFSHELENGAMWAKPAVAARRSLYDRNPLIFWKSLSAGLIVLVILLFAWR